MFRRAAGRWDLGIGGLQATPPRAGKSEARNPKQISNANRAEIQTAASVLFNHWELVLVSYFDIRISYLSPTPAPDFIGSLAPLVPVVWSSAFMRSALGRWKFADLWPRERGTPNGIGRSSVVKKRVSAICSPRLAPIPTGRAQEMVPYHRHPEDWPNVAGPHRQTSPPHPCAVNIRVATIPNFCFLISYF
jgi:hypothetical protein